MSIRKEICLSKAGISEDVVLFGILGNRILNPGYLNNSFIIEQDSTVEYHILHVIAILDKIGILSDGRVSTPLITSGTIAVSTEDSSLEGQLVYVQGSNKYLHLSKSPIGDYYAVSWKKISQGFKPISDKIKILTPDRFKSQEIIDIITNILYGIDDRIVEISYSCDMSNRAMIAIDSSSVTSNREEVSKNWLKDNTLSISHSKFNGINTSHLQEILNDMESLNETYNTYTRDDSDKLFLSNLRSQWSKELQSVGIFAHKSVNDSQIEAYRTYNLVRKLNGYICQDDKFAERIIWCLQYLPDYGSNRIHRWVHNISQQSVPSNEELDTFTDLVLQFGNEAMAVQGKEEYTEDKSSRLGYCLSLVPTNKFMKDTITPFFSIFTSTDVSFYPETSSTRYWLEQCESYGSMIALPTSSMRYYVNLGDFVNFCNLIIILDNNRDKLSLSTNMHYTKKYKPKSGESEIDTWIRTIRVNRETSIIDYPNDDIASFIKDYLRNDGKYINPFPSKCERLLRIISTL